MGYFEGKDIINVTGKGSVETDFVSATFNVNVKQRAKTGPAAKALAAPIIEKIKLIVAEYAKAADIETSRLRTTFTTDVSTDRMSGEPSGYECRYTLNFTAKNVAHATAVHDALTGIDGAYAPSPIFNIGNGAEHQAKAFEVAIQAVQRKFEAQCKALNLDPQDYIVSTWSPQDINEHHGKTLSLRDEEGPRPSLEPGKATLEVKVTVWYTRLPRLS